MSYNGKDSKEFRNLVVIKEVKDAFDNLVQRINDAIGKYNNSLIATKSIDFNYGSADLSSRGYALSLGGLKKVLKAYEGKLFGCNMYRIGTTNNYVITNGLYIAPSDRADGCPIPTALPNAILNNVNKNINQWVKYDFENKTYSVVSRSKFSNSRSRSSNYSSSRASSNGLESPAMYTDSNGYLIIPAGQKDESGNIINVADIIIQDVTNNIESLDLLYTQYIKLTEYIGQGETMRFVEFERRSDGRTDFYKYSDVQAGENPVKGVDYRRFGDLVYQLDEAHRDYQITVVLDNATYTGTGEVVIPQGSLSSNPTGTVYVKGRPQEVTKYQEDFYVYLINEREVVTTNTDHGGKNLGSFKLATNNTIYDLAPTGEVTPPEPEPVPLDNEGLFPINVNRDIKSVRTQPFQNGEISNLTINTGNNTWNNRTTQDISVSKKGKFICFHPVEGDDRQMGITKIFGIECNRSERPNTRNSCHWLCTNYFFLPKGVAHPFTFWTNGEGSIRNLAYEILMSWTTKKNN